MNLVRVRPQRVICKKPNAVNRDFDHFINDFFNTVGNLAGGDMVKKQTPAVNVSETDAAFQLELAAPGLEKEDFNINIESDQLTISAERKTETDTEEKKNTAKYTRREFNYSTFKRSFQLPENIEQEAIAANYKNGVLLVTLPKKATAEVETKRNISIS